MYSDWTKKPKSNQQQAQDFISGFCIACVEVLSHFYFDLDLIPAATGTDVWYFYFICIIPTKPACVRHVEQREYPFPSSFIWQICFFSAPSDVVRNSLPHTDTVERFGGMTAQVKMTGYLLTAAFLLPLVRKTEISWCNVYPTENCAELSASFIFILFSSLFYSFYCCYI